MLRLRHPAVATTTTTTRAMSAMSSSLTPMEDALRTKGSKPISSSAKQYTLEQITN